MDLNKIDLMNYADFEESISKVRDFVFKEKQPEPPKSTLVIGDIGLDKYLFGSVDRISPEAPVPVVSLKSKEKHLGLAANVAKNFSSLGGRCDLVGLIGEDSAGLETKKLLLSIPNLNAQLITSKTRPTTEKTRVISGQHHLLRLDNEQTGLLSDEDKESFLALINNFNFNEYSHIILEDYDKGVLFDELCAMVIKKAQESNACVLVDPAKKAQIKKFKGANIFKPNYSETIAYSDQAGTDCYSELVNWILKKGDFDHVVSTLGSLGMSICSEDKTLRVPTFARKVFDVTGAGDTVIASLAFALSKGLNEIEACIFANFAAGFVVGKVGAVSCTMENIKQHMERFSSGEIKLKFEEEI